MDDQEERPRQVPFPTGLAIRALLLDREEELTEAFSLRSDTLTARGSLELPQDKDLVLIFDPEIADNLSLLPKDYVDFTNGVVLSRLENKARFALIKQMARLKRVGLAFTRVSDAHLQLLSSLSNISELMLYHISTEIGSLPSLFAMQSIETLSLCGSNIDQDILSNLDVLPCLHTLTIDNCSIVGTLQGFGKLEKLSLKGSRFEPQLLSKLPDSLQELYLDECIVDDNSMLAIQSLSALKKLSLKNTLVTRLPTNLPHLREVSLSGCPIDFGEFSNSQIPSQLESLYLDCTRLGEQHSKLLIQLRQLKHLSVQHTELADQKI